MSVTDPPVPEGVEGHPQAGTHIWGWMLVPELAWLQKQAAKMDSIVEIGSLHGRSAFALLTACKGTVWCVDPWDDEYDRCYGSFMSFCGHFDNLRTIRGFSPQDCAGVPDVDMVFIDGDHTRAGIEADIDFWLPKTKKLLCGHDYYDGPEASYPDIAAVVNERFPDATTVPDTSIWAVARG